MSKFSEMSSQGITYSEQMQREHEAVADYISKLGNGMSKELAKSQGAQLVDNIKSVEFKEASNLPDTSFGRKLVKNLIHIIDNIAQGETLRLIVDTNYPVDRFIRKIHEYDVKAQYDLQRLEADLESEVGPPPHSLEYYTALGNLEYDEMALIKKREKAALRATAATLKQALKMQQPLEPKSEDSKSDDVDQLSGLSAPTAPSSRHPSPSAREDLEISKSEFMNRYTLMYLDAHNEYYEKQSKKLTYASRKKKVDEMIARSVVIVAILDGIRSAMNTIVNKIKACLATGHDKVRTKLCGMVVVEKTGELIVNPFENNNLSGIYHILKIEYHTATLVQFNRDFSDLLRNPFTTEELLRDPLKAINQIDKKVADWMLMSYGRFMTIDVFMVNILLMYLPPSAFKDRCVVSVTEFIQSKEAEIPLSFGANAESGVNSMLIYQHLVEFMKVQHNSIGYLQFGNNKPSSNPVNNSRTPKNVPAVGLEWAASVDSNSLYSNEITREKNLKMKDTETGREFFYTATKAQCPVCFGKSTGEKVESHTPRCYSKTCYKCNHYGHTNGNCLQHPSVYLPRPPKV